MMLPLLPGLAVAATVAGTRGLILFLLGLVPGLALAIPLEDVVSALSTGDARMALGLEGYVRYRFDYWRPFHVLNYAPGYLSYRPTGLIYLPVGQVYFLLVAAVYAFGLSSGATRERVLGGLFVSVGCLLVSFAFVDHVFVGQDPMQFNSLRYVAPLLPVASVVVLISCSRLASARVRYPAAAAGLLLILHAIGMASHVSVRRLFDQAISTAWIRPHTPSLDVLSEAFDALPASPRADRYALRLGTNVYRIEQADAARIDRRARGAAIGGRALEEYWRGVGRSHVRLRRSHLWNAAFLAEVPEEHRTSVWQGVGMEFHYEDYDDSTPEGSGRLLPATGAQLEAFAWGWGRACAHADHVPDLLPELIFDRRLARRVRWELDLAVAGAPWVSDEDLEALPVVRWSP